MKLLIYGHNKMNPENILLSKMSQLQNKKYYMIALIWNIIEAESRLPGAGGEKGLWSYCLVVTWLFLGQ
jgi:hypothetical protein